jgi:sulfopyruvate decarboxylase TPP-binding subunit
VNDPLPTPAGRRAADIATHFTHRGYGPFIGVPCGILAPLFSELDKAPAGFTYAPREDNAIAMACGAAAGGSRPIAVMQNSGLAQSVNTLASLTVPYRFAIGLIISLRGVAPDNTEENQVMGTATRPILDSLGIPHRTLTPDSYQESLQWLETVTTGEDAGPAALLVEPSFFEWNPTT